MINESFYWPTVSVIANGDTAELEDGNKTVILEADLKKNEPDLGKGKGLSSDQALELAKNVLNIVMQVGCENLKKFGRKTGREGKLGLIVQNYYSSNTKDPRRNSRESRSEIFLRTSDDCVQPCCGKGTQQKRDNSQL